jgi:hypothetical protein
MYTTPGVLCTAPINTTSGVLYIAAIYTAPGVLYIAQYTPHQGCYTQHQCTQHQGYYTAPISITPEVLYVHITNIHRPGAYTSTNLSLIRNIIHSNNIPHQRYYTHIIIHHTSGVI